MWVFVSSHMTAGFGWAENLLRYERGVFNFLPSQRKKIKA
jgi:hypothetical protein